MRGLPQVAGVSLLTILMECIKGRWSLVLASSCLPFPGREAAWELAFEDDSFSGGQKEQERLGSLGFRIRVSLRGCYSAYHRMKNVWVLEFVEKERSPAVSYFWTPSKVNHKQDR